MEYIVEYDYDAVHEDELTIRVGNLIKNVTKLDEEGWLEGEMNGKRGAFPDNFVKEIKKDTEPKEETIPKREKGGNVANLVQRMSVIGIPGIGPPPQNKSFKKKSKKRQCKVLFDYIPQNEDELELKVGEVLDITEEVEEGWWSGAYCGRSGLFPSNFVKELDLSDDAESQESSEDTAEPAATAASASPASPVLSPANTSDVSPVTVAQPKKVMGIGFGDIFKDGVKLKPRIPAAETEIRKPEKPSLTPSPAAKVSRTTSLDQPRTETDSKPKAKEMCRALYLYEGVNDDELSFKEGDIIHLINKETGDHGWWRGELNGKEGVFPDNFAVIILDSEKEKPKKPPPPVKSAVPKPELRLGDKKFTLSKSEEKDEKPSVESKPSVEPKPSKPAAPLVPPKKPSLVNKSNSLVKPATVPPKRPEKPALPTPSKPNGESPRPKSEFEPFSRTKMDLEQILSRPKSQEVEPSVVRSPKESAPSELSFDDLLPTSENLSHPTASRPKMIGKRLPGRFNGFNSNNKDETDSQKVSIDHEEEDESAKIATPEIKKPIVPTSSTSIFTPTSSTSIFTPTPSTSIFTPTPSTSIFTPTSSTSIFTPISSVSKPSNIPMFPILVDIKTKPDQIDGKKSEVEELRAQLSELLTIVDALRKEHRKEIDKLKKDLEDEKLLRSSLEIEIDKLKKAVHLT